MSEHTLRIVCSAIRAEDGSLLIGIRHYSGDMYSQIYARKDGDKFCHRSGDDQGFVDQRGKYYTRMQAWNVAKAAGQIITHNSTIEGKLHSEDLY